MWSAFRWLEEEPLLARWVSPCDLGQDTPLLFHGRRGVLSFTGLGISVQDKLK